jgi:hypothetical protein
MCGFVLYIEMGHGVWEQKMVEKNTTKEPCPSPSHYPLFHVNLEKGSKKLLKIVSYYGVV